MQYLLLIYHNEATTPDPDSPEMAAGRKAYADFTTEIRESAHFKGGNALLPSTHATSVRVRDGKTLLTDGPFAETAEQLAGYYLIEAANLDDAIAIGARIPGAKWGSIEVRPVRAMATLVA